MFARCRPLVALVSVVLVATAVACSDEGGDSEGDGRTRSGLGSVTASLAAMPEVGRPDEVTQWVWGDLEQAAELAGVSRPTGLDDRQAVVDYVQVLTGMGSPSGDRPRVALVPPEAAHVSRAPDLADFTHEVGWNLLEVDRFVERQSAPNVVTVLEGSFDEEALTGALGEPDDGTWVAGSGESFAIDPAEVSPARPVGESLWLGLDGAHLTVARSSADSTAARRAVAGGDRAATLADDEALVRLAEALDAESPYGALLVRPAPVATPDIAGATPEQIREQFEEACDQAQPPAAAVATGIADDDGPVILVAFAHVSDAAAEVGVEAVERLVTDGDSLASRRPWRELVSLDDVTVTGDGRTVLARLRPTEAGHPALWYQAMVQQDSLVASC